MVNASIPLLWGKESMKKAGVLLDLSKDKAKIRGEWTELTTGEGDHYDINMLPNINTIERIWTRNTRYNERKLNDSEDNHKRDSQKRDSQEDSHRTDSRGASQIRDSQDGKDSQDGHERGIQGNSHGDSREDQGCILFKIIKIICSA